MTRQLQTLLKTTLLLLLLATASLQAGSMSAQRELGDKAYNLHEKGMNYFQNKEYSKALKYFQEAYAVEPSSVSSYNIALIYDETLHDYPNAIKWYEKAAKMGNQLAVENLGVLYEKNLKDYPNAIKWYKKAYQAGNSTGALYLALLYDETLKDYPKAIEWYKKAYAMGNQNAARDLAIFYKNTLKDYPKAIEWYKKAVQAGYIPARKSLGLLYHSQKDDLNSAIYMMGMINHPYTRDRVIGLLKDDWKIDHKTLLKAYQLQKKLIPDPYTDPIFEKELHSNQSNTSKQEEEPTHHRHGDK